VWGIPCVVLTTIIIFRTYDLVPEISRLLVLVPTIVVFQSCLEFTQGLLPDILTATAFIVDLARKALKRERRAELRFDIDVPLVYTRRRSSAECRSIASQISNCGFCLQASRNLMRGEIIRFELEVEDSSVHGEARIAWTKSVKNTDRRKALFSASGCHIISMASNYKHALKGYLKKLSVEEA
jgi:hypothetical protein